MSSLFEGIGHAVAQFAWQGLVLWGVTAACLRALRGADPRQRYLVSIGALAAGLGLFLVSILEGASLALELDAGAGPGSVPALAGLIESTVPAAGPHPWQAPLAWAWTLGAGLMGLRLLAGLHIARGLRARALRVQEPAWLDLVAQLSRQLGIRGSIELLKSSGVTSPAVIGWWRPVLLVPASMLTGLSHEHVRAVLAHELAHIRRWDPLFNAALAVTQVLLFFHPFTWWLVRRARAECEHCCDDLAISLLPSPRLLAEALTRLEAQRLTSDLALSARPKESPLMLRIQRILAPSRRPSPLAGRVASVAALLVGAALTGADPFLPGARAATEPVQEAEKGRVQDKRKVDLEARYAQAVARCEAAVKAGKLSAEDAELKLAELRKEMFGDRDRTEGASDMEARRRKYAELAREIKAAVGAGKLSPEDAERKLIELRKEMFGDRAKANDAADMEARRRKYAELEREIKAAVGAGKLSAEDAERKLIALREEMFDDRAKDKGNADMEARRRKYAELEREIKAAVGAGKLSAEDAERKLIALRKEMFDDRAKDKGSADMEARRRKYAELEREIKAAVGAGKLSAADAERKLIELRKEMFGEPADAGKKREKGVGGDDQRARRLRYAEAERRIQAAVAAGEVSPEDAERKLAELRARLFGDRDEKGSGSGEREKKRRRVEDV